MSRLAVFVSLLLLLLALVSGTVAVGGKGGATAITTSRIKAFDEWARQNGVQTRNLVTVEEFVDTGLGLGAAQDIKEGEEIIRIPLSIFMTSDDAKRDSILGTALTDFQISMRASNHVILAIFLVTESANPHSRWRDWINVLPLTFNSPLYFSQLELKELKGSHIVAAVEERNRRISEIYKTTLDFFNEKHPNVLNPEIFTPEAFKWATSMVYAKGVHLKNDLYCFIPYLNFANAADVQTEFLIADNNQTMSVVTHTPFKEGEQIFVSHGRLPNYELFLSRGYLFDDEKYYSFILPVNLELDPTDLLAPVKANLLAKEQLHTSADNPNYFLVHGNSIPPLLLRACRIMSLTPADLEPARQSLLSTSSSEDRPISLENELKTLRFLVQSLRRLIAGYDTTVEEDNLILKKKVSDHVRQAVVLRKGEKMAIANMATQLHARWSAFLLSSEQEFSSQPEPQKSR